MVPRIDTNLSKSEPEEPGTGPVRRNGFNSTCYQLTKQHEPFPGKWKTKEWIYLNTYNFCVSALKPTPSTSDAFVKYSSKTFWEE